MGDKRQLAFILAFTLCFAVRSTARYSPWAMGNEYVYRMRTISTNDISGLGPQAAGTKLKCQLVVQCRDSASIIVKLVDVTSWKFNDDVEEVWEEIDAADLLGTQAVLDGKTFLEKPFIIRHREGLFESLSLSADEPLWSINVKKAIASKLQLHVSGSRSFDSASRNFERLANEPTADVNAVFEVYETGVTGECETVYEISPLSDALIRSDSKLNPVPELCTEGTFFQVVKTKDYSRCRSKRPIFNVIAPSGWRCRPDVSTCNTALSRSSVNRYIACGSLESFTLLKMTHQSEVRVNPYAYDTHEQLRAISLMKLTLQTVRPAFLVRGAGRRFLNKEYAAGPIVTSLVFTFPGMNAAGVEWNEDNHLNPPSIHDTDHLQAAEMHHKAAHLIARAVDQIEANQEAAIDSISSLSQLMRQCTYAGLLSVVGDLDMRKSNERNVILDALMAAGTNPSILYLKEAILFGRLSRTETLQAIAGLPMYVRTPTREVLNELYDMTIKVKNLADRSVYHAALLSTSQLLYTACINVTETRSRFPTALYGNFCEPNDFLITEQLVPLLQKELHSSQSLENVIVALTALGDLGHESIISIVSPIIDAKEHYSALVRTRAVVSLHKLAHDSNEHVLNALSTVYNDQWDCSEVRLAAFSLMILANPPAYRWQKIAVSSWFEQNAHVASFVYTTFASLATNVQPLGNMKEMSEKAQILLPLVKRVPLGVRYSQSLKLSHILPNQNIGAEFHYESLNAFDSLIPKSIYSRLSWALGPYHFDVFELEMFGEHFKSFWNDLASKMRSYFGDSNDQSKDFDLHPDLQRLKKHLIAKNILPVLDTGSTNGHVHLNFMKAIHRFESIRKGDVLGFLHELMTRSKNASQSEISFQKWMPFAHAEMLMPNTLGFLVHIRIQADLLAVAKGKVQISANGLSEFANLKEASSNYSNKSWGLAMELKTTAVVKLRSSMETSMEFATAVTVSGVDTSVSLNLPGHYSIGYDRDNAKLALAWKPVSSAEPASLFHYSVRPFTSLRNPCCYDRFHVTNDIKEVAADGVTPQNYESIIGEKTGFYFKYSSYSEAPTNTKSSSDQSLSDLLTNLNFAILPASLQKQSYRVTLDPLKSKMDLILFSVKFDVARKFQKGTLIVNIGPKAQIKLKDSEQRIQFSINTDPYIREKLSKVLGSIEKGIGLHIETKLILNSQIGTAKAYESIFTGGFESDGTRTAANARLELPFNQHEADTFTVCIDAGGQYSRVLSLNRHDLIERPPEANWNVTVGLGNMCQHQLTFEVDMKGSDSFSRRRVLNSAEKRECSGEYNHEQCSSVQQYAAMFDEYQASVKYDQVPLYLANAAHGLEALIRNQFNSYTTKEYLEVKNNASEIKITIKLHPSLSAFDLIMFNSQSNVFFRDIPLSEVANIFFPLGAESLLANRLMDNTANDRLMPFCRIDNDSITTFEKEQYNASINDCEHIAVAVQDYDSFAILIRQEKNQKIVTLLADRGKLEILPVESKMRYNGMEVSLNDEQPIEIYHANQSSTSEGSSIGANKVGPGAFKITAHYLDFHMFIDASSGIVIKAPRSLQGKMIGLCADAGSVRGLNNAQRCVPSSYRIYEAGERCATEEVRNQSREEETACQVKRESATNTARKATSVDCFVRRTMVLHRDDAKCFSVSPVRECRADCQGRSLRAFHVGFHCVPNSKIADEWAHEAEFKELTFVYGKKEDIRTTRHFPTVCHPMTGQSDPTVT